MVLEFIVRLGEVFAGLLENLLVVNIGFLGMLPPVPRGLDIDSIRSKLLNSVFSSMGKSV